jgi:hypothetical protein
VDRYSRPELYLIGGDDRFEVLAVKGQPFEDPEQLERRLRALDTFYEVPVCRTCKRTVGRRSDAPLTLKHVDADYDGAFGCLGADGGPQHQVVSEQFLELLTPGERSGLKLRPVLSRSRKRFFELVGPEGPPPVAVAGMHVSGWRCASCGYRTWGYWIDGMEIHSFVAQADLPASSSGVFTVGAFPEIEIAVTGARWSTLVGRNGTSGFVARPLGVVPDAEVIRQPDLPSYEEALRVGVG